MAYGRFAHLYDELMSDVPYEKWMSYVKQYVPAKGASVLDVACGTGTITQLFMQHGYNVTGVDLSEEMLAVAAGKVGDKVPLYAQDMSQLDIGATFDVVTIFCDSLNYVLDEEDIKRTFASVYEHVKQDGYFLFDVHSLYKIHDIFANETFTVNEEEISLIWNCFEGEYEHSVEHELTFFTKDEQNDYYHRFDEFHVQRTFEPAQYIQWLEEAGFEVVSVRAEYGDEDVEETSDRIFFAARKNK
ncbi:class I SAM-dependent DNA methyltransferase [Priestia taiwanensis]|uniref:Methyltransferase n=1 Tax=Priestia taiwanensis TaxID=1347902 RepID=A0A917AU95_9BACI|nr:class I SAM-dependent methyltransferase [Priestia taiwanensis]MBM7363711.1 SAM-dependent methyltransferase [Priestia taiwanensis]GGE74751.1 methyltransferase [Priestia taiwanensis]